MGIVVSSGAITALGSAVFLFGAQIMTFNKFAIIICCTIAMSYLVSIFFFGAFMHICGPKEEDDEFKSWNKD